MEKKEDGRNTSSRERVKIMTACSSLRFPNEKGREGVRNITPFTKSGPCAIIIMYCLGSAAPIVRCDSTQIISTWQFPVPCSPRSSFARGFEHNHRLMPKENANIYQTEEALRREMSYVEAVNLPAIKRWRELVAQSTFRARTQRNADDGQSGLQWLWRLREPRS